MLTDAAALALAWIAFRVGRWPRDARRTYGYHRFQVLAAFVNGLTLIAIVGWIAIEAVRRLFAPVEVLGGLMLAIAVRGLLVNLAAFEILRRGDRENLNLRGAALHVLGDLLGSATAIVGRARDPLDRLDADRPAAVAAGRRPDPAQRLERWCRRSAHILLEGAPDWLDVAELRACGGRGVARDPRHPSRPRLDADQRAPLITLHAEIAPGANHQQALAAIRAVLEHRFGIDHATIQIETAGCSDERSRPRRAAAGNPGDPRSAGPAGLHEAAAGVVAPDRDRRGTGSCSRA